MQFPVTPWHAYHHNNPVYRTRVHGHQASVIQRLFPIFLVFIPHNQMKQNIWSKKQLLDNYPPIRNTRGLGHQQGLQGEFWPTISMKLWYFKNKYNKYVVKYVSWWKYEPSYIYLTSVSNNKVMTANMSLIQNNNSKIQKS